MPTDDTPRFDLGRRSPSTRPWPAARVATYIAALVFIAVAPAAAAPVHPNDPLYPLSQPALDLMHVPDAWAITEGDPATVVAVIDKGVTPVPDLEGALIPGYNFDASNADTTDYDDHGTAMASLIAARIDNGIGSAGVCPRCAILPVKGDLALAQAVTWAVGQGAKVLNMSVSLKPGVADPTINAAIADAVSHGVVVVIAAANERSSDGSIFRLASENSEAIRVGAVDAGGTILADSNHGSWVDLAAATTLVAQLPDTRYVSFGKTSTATAAVSGIAALLLTKYSWLTPAQVKQLLMATSTPEPGLDVVSGGVVNADRALTDAPSMFKLELRVKVQGPGTVVGRPHISCTSVCSIQVPHGAQAALTAKPAKDARFVRWRDACSGVKPSCTVSVDHRQVLTAVFAKKTKTPQRTKRL